MKIQAISTGKVKITQNWRLAQGSGLKRLMNTLLDNEFTAWLPIYVWLIEHPEGLILIDTGIPADANKRIWFPPFMPLLQRAATFEMPPEEEIGPQLQQSGFAPADVRWVILTHLHQDHDGGLHYFPQAEFIVSQTEWAAATGLKGRMNGYLNQRWPEWFQPTLINFEPPSYESFAGHHTLTNAGDVHLLPTPGHSPGHMSIIVEDGNVSFFFAGDASYTEELLLAEKPDGIGPEPQKQQETHQRILAYAAQKPTVYLPSHDPEAQKRLANRAAVLTNKNAASIWGGDVSSRWAEAGVSPVAL